MAKSGLVAYSMQNLMDIMVRPHRIKKKPLILIVTKVEFRIRHLRPPVKIKICWKWLKVGGRREKLPALVRDNLVFLLLMRGARYQTGYQLLCENGASKYNGDFVKSTYRRVGFAVQVEKDAAAFCLPPASLSLSILPDILVVREASI